MYHNVQHLSRHNLTYSTLRDYPKNLQQQLTTIEKPLIVDSTSRIIVIILIIIDTILLSIIIVNFCERLISVH